MSRPTSPRAQQGATLIELMVALVIGTVIVLALMIVTSRFESGKRQSGAASDLSMSAGSIALDLDRQIRSAGSGFMQSYYRALGCTINASRLIGATNTQLLPRTAAFPSPFGSVPQQVRLIPFLIYAGIGNGGSDVISVMSGTSGVGEVGMQLKPGTAQSAQLAMTSTVALRPNDMLMMIESGRPCLLTQVDASFVQSASSSLLPLGGAYYASTVNGVAVSDYGANDLTYVLNMGNASDNAPQFTLYGVDSSYNLQAFDLLSTNGSVGATTVLSNIIDMRALYGVPNATTGDIDWKSPAVSPYTAAELSNGSAAAQATLASIRAVRIALILRSERIEAGPGTANVTGNKIQMFADQGTLEIDHALSATEQNERFRLVEFSVPLRNALLLPTGIVATDSTKAQATP